VLNHVLHRGLDRPRCRRSGSCPRSPPAWALPQQPLELVVGVVGGGWAPPLAVAAAPIHAAGFTRSMSWHHGCRSGGCRCHPHPGSDFDAALQSGQTGQAFVPVAENRFRKKAIFLVLAGL
jgi:hypothetical protein